MTLLFDGDLLAYRAASSCKEGDELEISLHRLDKQLREILENLGATKYRMFLSDDKNFRKKVNPNYKISRLDVVPPQWLQQTKQFLRDEWNAESEEFLEADDLLGINQTEDTVIVTLDKDLLMIPGQHYSWEISGRSVNGKEWVREARSLLVSEPDDLHTFYRQLLTGDNTDDIVGVHRLGPKTAEKLINCLWSEQEMLEVVFNKYGDDYTRILNNGMCLWIMRKYGETWAHYLQKQKQLILPKEFALAVDQMCESTKFFFPKNT